MEAVYDAIAASAAQKAFCKERGIPMFAPDNGWCYRCGGNIYEPYTCRRGNDMVTYGISVEDAGKRLITGCPLCHKSFSD